MITSVGEHKATVEIELGDGTVVRHVVKFSGGNPLHHAKEATSAMEAATESVADALVGMYGEVAITSADVNRAGAAKANAIWGGSK